MKLDLLISSEISSIVLMILRMIDKNNSNKFKNPVLNVYYIKEFEFDLCFLLGLRFVEPDLKISMIRKRQFSAYLGPLARLTGSSKWQSSPLQKSPWNMTVSTIMMPVDTRIAIVARMICPMRTYVDGSS